MNLKRIVLHNFVSYKDAAFDFSQDGVYNIAGKNGAGKSSIRDALTWCLFGKSRAIDMDKLIHEGTKEMCVLVDFEVNGKSYKVIRQKGFGESAKLMVEEI